MLRAFLPSLPGRADCADLLIKTSPDFRTLIARVSDWATAMLYGLHCLRVSGWNGARQGPAGEECAVAHGGWHGGSQRRYDRFGRDEILGLPAAILGAPGPAHVFDGMSRMRFAAWACEGEGGLKCRCTPSSASLARACAGAWRGGA